MSPNPLPQGVVRSAAAVNEDIRAFWTHRDKRLTDEERAEYEELVEEYVTAAA